MLLHQRIQDELKVAMRAKDVERISAIRNVLAACTNELISKKSTEKSLSDDGVVSVMRRLVKQQKDSIQQFTGAGRQDLVKAEEQELQILLGYLPKTMSREEILPIAETLKTKLAVTDKSKLGLLMGAVMNELRGKAQGEDVKAVVESLFS